LRDVENRYKPTSRDVENRYKPTSRDVERHYKPILGDVERHHKLFLRDVERPYKPGLSDTIARTVAKPLLGAPLQAVVEHVHKAVFKNRCELLSGDIEHCYKASLSAITNRQSIDVEQTFY
jgi:hypothetical protein